MSIEHMSTPLHHEYFGPYKLIRQIGSAHGASRYIVLCNRTDTNYTLYRFEDAQNHQFRRQAFQAFMKMSVIDQPHIHRIISVTYDDRGRLCVITPYTGNHEGIVTLDDVLRRQDGKLGIVEAARAIEHLLGAVQYAHRHQVINGSIDRDDILVDRYGSLQIQFYGYKSSIRSTQRHESTRVSDINDEVRSIIELGYTMITGLRVQGERIDPSRVIKKLDRAWDTWFEIGLDPIDGFENLEHARLALPTNPTSSEWLVRRTMRSKPQVHIGSMLRRRFRSAPGSGTRSAD